MTAQRNWYSSMKLAQKIKEWYDAGEVYAEYDPSATREELTEVALKSVREHPENRNCSENEILWMAQGFLNGATDAQETQGSKS